MAAITAQTGPQPSISRGQLYRRGKMGRDEKALAKVRNWCCRVERPGPIEAGSSTTRALPRHARKSVGGALTIWSGVWAQQDNCQVAVTCRSPITSELSRWPIRMYLPKEWAMADRKRRRKVGVH